MLRLVPMQMHLGKEMSGPGTYRPRNVHSRKMRISSVNLRTNKKRRWNKKKTQCSQSADHNGHNDIDDLPAIVSFLYDQLGSVPHGKSVSAEHD